MKKFTMLMLALVFTAFAGVQAAQVTFNLSMKVKVQMGEFDPLTQHVRITGNLVDPNWDPASAPILDLIDSTNYIYSTTLDIAAGDYEYKYLIGDAWGNDELQGQPNRSLTVGNDDMNLDLVYFNNVDHVPFTQAPSGKVNVMLNVNMTRWAQKGAFDPDKDTVRVTGNITDPQWDPANAPIMEDNDGNLVYTTTLQVEPGSYEYKYLLGSAWGRDELQGQPNRQITVTADTALFPVYFDNEPYVVNPPVSTDSVMLTLNVNMRVKTLEGDFNPASDFVVAAGSFQGWNAGAAPHMTDDDGDSIYTGTYKVPTNATYEYKFVINGTSWETRDDRHVVVDDSDVTVPPVYFDDDSVVTIKANGHVKFTVNMDVLTEVGLFNPTVDSVHVRGSFNGWNSDDPARSHMNQNLTNPLNWFLNVPFTDFGIGDPLYYKFWVYKQDPVVNGVTWADGWERPTITGGGNRAANFEGTDNQEIEPDYYDHIKPDQVVPQGTGLKVTFNVDMKPAADPNLQAIPFTAGEDTVYWICEEPAFVVTQGWEDSDNMRVLKLTDPDGDMVYSGTLEVKEPAWNAFVYRYAFISKSDGGTWQLEPAGFGNFNYRVRFVGQDAARSFPYKDWNMPLDTWTNAEVKTDQETDPYTSLTAIGDATKTLPTRFELKQNYPNPFNPTTMISFTLPQAAHVTLTVYDVLGQKVRTLIDNKLATAGTHFQKWNGKDDFGHKVASGIYFYKIKAGNFSAIRKMVLMK
ncbi:hypothetical protein DRI50_03050 [candidate division KSB1 bacterium]|nr:MAG: hypothetical protein DRI50_03050 [candidate division KSB1 bacterium]